MATFGTTTIGGTSNSGTAGPLGSKFTAPATGTITDMTFYGRVDSGNAVLLIYADSAGSPTTLLAQSASQAGWTVVDWHTASVSLAITSGTVYWLMMSHDTGGPQYTMYYDAGSSNQLSYTGSGGIPDPYGTPNFLAWNMSIYATYTTGGAVDIPLPVSDDINDEILSFTGSG